MEIWKGKPIKNLTKPYLGSLGRSSNGSISSRHRQSGHKRRYRVIDRFFLNSVPAVIRRFDYDPSRNVALALLCFSNGFLAYSVAAKGSKVGDFIYPPNYFKSEVDGSFATLGSSLALRYAPVGSVVYNAELREGSGGALARSGGSSAHIIAKLRSWVLLKLSSGKYKAVPDYVRAQVGVSCPNAKTSIKLNVRKAGRSRWLGNRPSVRGVAMNPVDHPHGGGEGKASGGRCSVTPWGKLTKGKRTTRGNPKAELSKFYKKNK